MEGPRSKQHKMRLVSVLAAARTEYRDQTLKSGSKSEIESGNRIADVHHAKKIQRRRPGRYHHSIRLHCPD